MKKAVLSCGGGTIIGELCELAAYEMVRRKIVDRKICTGKLIKGDESIKQQLKRYDEITILEACSSLCVTDKISQLLPEKNIKTICLPRQGFSKDRVKDARIALDELMPKIIAYFKVAA